MKSEKLSSIIVDCVKTHWQAILSICLVMFTVLIVYGQDLLILFDEAMKSDSMSHVVVVPLLAGYLLYRKKEMLKASVRIERLREKSRLVSIDELLGLAVCLFALLFYWYGSYTFYPLEYHVVSLVIFLAGATIALFNLKALMYLIFPILFLLFLMPPPSGIVYSAGAFLGNFNAQASYTIVKNLGVPVVLSTEYGPPSMIVNDLNGKTLEFAVDVACSGVYSLVAFAMFATFLAYIVGSSTARRAMLFPLGFLMLPLLNISRISFVVLVAYNFGESAAMTIFHTFSGWVLIFVGMLALLLIAERFLHVEIIGTSTSPAPCTECGAASDNGRAFCTKCGRLLRNSRTNFPRKFWINITALMLVSCLVVLSIQAPVFAFAEGLTISGPTPESNTEAFPQVSGYRLRYLYRDQAFEKVSKQDASLLYAYISDNVTEPTVYVLVGVASSLLNLHSWEVCLVTWQAAQGLPPQVNVLDSRDSQIIQNPPVIARYFVFQHPANYTQVTLYWYQRALFKTAVTIEPKYTRISLIILTGNTIDYSRFEEKLVGMGAAIATRWTPLKAQSLISLGIPTVQALLILIVVFAAFLQVTRYTTEWRQKRTNLNIFEKLSSPKEKILLQTIKDAGQKTRQITTQDIASSFERGTGEKLELDDLTTMLHNLEKHGIIRTDVVDIKDQPKFVWKT